MGKTQYASSAVAAHASFLPVGIEVYHFKVISLVRVQQHETVGPNAKSSVTHGRDMLGVQAAESAGPVIQKDEVVAGALVFKEWDLHGAKLENVNGALRGIYQRVIISRV